MPPTAAPTSAQRAPTPDFERDATRVLGRLRAAVGRVVASVPGEVRRAIDVRKSLGLDGTLAWQVHTLANAADALGAIRQVPKSGAMERFVRAAAAAGVASAVTSEAEAAYADLDRLITEHAGDRATFDAMILALRPDNSTELQRLRRAAFKANSAVWGVAVHATTHCVIFNQRNTGEHDCLAVRGRTRLRRLQEQAVIGIYASGRTWGGGTTPPDNAARQSLDRCQLIEEFCSQPIPHIDRVEAPDGTIRDYLHLEGLGRTSAVTLFWRNVALDFPDGTTTPPHGMTSPCLEPSELLVADLLLPRGWVDPASARAWATPENSRYAVSRPGQEPHQLPLDAAAVYLGTRLEALATPDLPDYAALITRQLATMGWQDDAFDIFRCIVRYPVLHASLHLAVMDVPAGAA